MTCKENKLFLRTWGVAKRRGSEGGVFEREHTQHITYTSRKISSFRAILCTVHIYNGKLSDRKSDT